jgi:uncharacterized protein (TIGR03437 family)
MTIPGSLALKLCLCAVAAASVAAASSLPTLSASPSAVVFQYNPPEPEPLPVYVTVTASNGTSPTIQVGIQPGGSTPSSLFPQPAVTGDKIQVYYNLTTFSELASQPGIYTATITVTASGFASLQIPVTFNIGSTLSIVPSLTSLTFDVPGPTIQTIQLSSNGGSSIGFSVAVTTSAGGNWLSAIASPSYTTAALTVAIAPLNIAGGTYSGSVTVTPTAGTTTPLVIPVTMQVGPNTLLATPASFLFDYTLGGTIPPAQVLQLSSTLPTDTYVAQASSTGNWLLVNGATANVSGTLPASLNVTVNPAGLAAGTYQGTITAIDEDNGTQTITVTLVITGLSNVVNPDSLVFVAQVNGSAPAPQFVAVNGFGSATYTATVNGTWLSVSSTSGTAPTQLTISANPTGLIAGTYSGSVAINLDTHIQNIQVTLIVSTSPVLTSDPGGFILSYQGGTAAPTPVTLNIGSSNSQPLAFTFAPGVPSWLQIGSTGTSLNTPASLTLALSPQTLPTGTYLAQIFLIPAETGGATVVVPVLLQVIDAPAVVPAVTSLSFSAVAGAAPASQTVEVQASTSTAFTATTSTVTGGNWLSVTPTTAVANLATTLTVTAYAASLTAGTYQGTVTLTTTGGVVTEIAVTFTVTGSSGGSFSVSPSSLAFASIENGPAPAAQTVQVTGSQSFTASAGTSTGGTWLAVTPTSGTGNASLSASVNPAGLAIGTYSGSITVTPASGVAQIVAVTLTVSGPGSLTAAPSALTFAYSAGTVSPAPQTVSVTSSGEAVTFTATATSSGWLSVTPTSATTPATLSVSVNPANLGGGTYTGTIALSGSSGTLQLNITVTLTVTTALPVLDKIVNAASYVQGSIAPGEIVTLFGSSLGPATGVGATIDSQGYIPTTLANVQVTFNGYPGPILYAGAGQVNTIVPYELTAGSNASVEVVFGTARSNSLTLPVVSAAPGVFSADASGQGGGAILDVNYHLVSSSNPVSPGSAIQIFATGQGQTSPPGVDGLIEPLTLPLPYPLLAGAVTINNIPANILYVGAAPGLVAGALQVNAIVPGGLAPGNATLFVSIGGIDSQTGITVAIQ